MRPSSEAGCVVSCRSPGEGDHEISVQKSVRIDGVRVNMNKKSLSVSGGTKGLRYTVNSTDGAHLRRLAATRRPVRALLEDTLAELRRGGITLLVQARDNGLADTYIRHGAVRPDPSHPRHLAWLSSAT